MHKGERKRETEMTKMTAAERDEYYSPEATDRRIRAAADLINKAWELAGANDVKIREFNLESAMLFELTWTYQDYEMALTAHIEAGHIIRHAGGTLTTNI